MTLDPALFEAMMRSTRAARDRSERRHRQSGQSLVELALVLPLLLLLLMGVIEIGRYAYIGILVGNAARAGAAYGTLSLVKSVDTAGINAAADNDFQNNGQNVVNLTITSSVSCGCDNGGAITTAACTGIGAGTCASGTFNALFNYPGLPPSISITRTSVMRVNLYG